jgi:hypothetical protein
VRSKALLAAAKVAHQHRFVLTGFQTLLGLGSLHEPTTYRQIVQTERTG